MNRWLTSTLYRALERPAYPRRLRRFATHSDPPLRAETERYGHYSVAGASVCDPFLWGSSAPTGFAITAWPARRARPD
jgi:hypothetical protein